MPKDRKQGKGNRKQGGAADAAEQQSEEQRAKSEEDLSQSAEAVAKAETQPVRRPVLRSTTKDESRGEGGNSELQAKIDELNEALLRERADAENVRRRAEEDRVKLSGFYKALVVQEFLPVIDNFERAMAAVQQSEERRAKSEEELSQSAEAVAKAETRNSELGTHLEGFEVIYKQFGDALKKLGVERIKTVGEPFDPECMEAVSSEEGDGDQEVVSEELQSGYRIGDELLRPAMVRVKS